jgi:hypothetical protein
LSHGACLYAVSKGPHPARAGSRSLAAMVDVYCRFRGKDQSPRNARRTDWRLLPWGHSAIADRDSEARTGGLI